MFQDESYIISCLTNSAITKSSSWENILSTSCPQKISSIHIEETNTKVVKKCKTFTQKMSYQRRITQQ